MKIVLWIVGLVIIIAGGFFIYTTYYMADNTGASDAQQTAGTDDVVQAQDVTVGTGAEAKPGSVVSILYAGRLTDGTVFDSSEAHGNEPLKFQLGAQGIIPGFQIGVNGMKVGGERLIAVPPAFGYGTQDITNASGQVIIPANSTLIFNIKLVAVEEAPAAEGTGETE